MKWCLAYILAATGVVAHTNQGPIMDYIDSVICNNGGEVSSCMFDGFDRRNFEAFSAPIMNGHGSKFYTKVEVKGTTVLECNGEEEFETTFGASLAAFIDRDAETFHEMEPRWF